jgi:hypothetical protein
LEAILTVELSKEQLEALLAKLFADRRLTFSEEIALEEVKTTLLLANQTTPAKHASDLLCLRFLAITGKKYAWNGAKDGAALSWLLKAADLDEVLTRWERGLKATGWRNVATVAQLRMKFNDLATAERKDGGDHRRAVLGDGDGPVSL